MQSSATFIRTRLTWQAYLTISYYSYLLNALGPLTPFLREELSLSYTLASFHFSAFAVGVIINGLTLSRAARRFGAQSVLWAGAVGMSAGALLLMAGRSPAVTITGAFLMGFMGVLLIALMNSTLASCHSQHSAIAFTESAVLGSLFATLAPLAIGFFARTALTWRGALGMIVLTLPLLWLVYGRDRLPEIDTPPASGPGPFADDAPQVVAAPQIVAASHAVAEPLPRAYWFYWFAILLTVAVEFCIIFWAADYLEKVSGLRKADAALAVSAFLGAELAGRIINSFLLRRISEVRLFIVSLALSGVGFALFWLVPTPLPAMAGLVLAGLGVAAQFPIINAWALSTVPGRIVEASGRISLAVGLAILLLPLLLGRLADWAGIRLSYGVVAGLLVLLVVTSLLARRTSAGPVPYFPCLSNLRFHRNGRK